MSDDFVKFPDHLSVAVPLGQISQAPVWGVEAEWGFLRIDKNLSLNLGFTYATSLSPAPRPESNLWGTDISRYAGHVGADYRLILFPGRSISLGITPAVRLFFGAQSYSPRLSEDPAVLREICEKYGRFGATTGPCTNPAALEPYPRGAPNGTQGIFGLQAGGNAFLSVNGDRVIQGLGWIDFSLGVYGDTEGGIFFSPGIRGNF
jgi:hypothetical protein